jgi:tRNA(Ile)-lysidine synthase
VSFIQDDGAVLQIDRAGYDSNVSSHLLQALLATVPPGKWGIAVSGGADSVALLLLLSESKRVGLSLHVIHLDHETRNGQSASDAEFVRELAHRLGLTCTVELRSTIEQDIRTPQKNVSARFRAARFELFSRLVKSHGLCGVILAHHAEDQAETILQRLLRGSGAVGLGGMRTSARINGVRVLRPLLGVRRDDLRKYLRERDQAWREDPSNASGVYLRNRLRQLLASKGAFIEALLRLGESSRKLRDWARQSTPRAGPTLGARELFELPGPLQREVARQWLAARGVPRGRIDASAINQLIAMLEDAATPGRQHFPGKVLVRRSRGTLSALR